MRIAFFTESYLPNTDGVVTSILSFKKQLERLGHEIFVFAPGRDNIDDEENGVFYYKSRFFKEYPNFPVPVYPTILIERSVRLVKKHDIDLIHVHSPGAMGFRGLHAARRLKIPSVLTYHTLLPELTGYIGLIKALPKLDGHAKSLVWRLSSWFFRNSNAIIAPSEAIRKEIVGHCNINPAKVSVVPTGINISKYTGGVGERVRKKHDLRDGRIILHIGRIVKEKRLETIIMAAEIMRKWGIANGQWGPGNGAKNIKFMVVGKGPAAEYYRNLVKKTGVEDLFVFTGYVPDEEVSDYYHAADTFVIASDTETQGLVVLEAFASGTPVAAANALSLPEFVINDYNGFLFEAGNPESCAEAIRSVLDRRENLIRGAVETVSDFTEEKCTQRLLRVYDRVLSKPGK